MGMGSGRGVAPPQEKQVKHNYRCATKRKLICLRSTKNYFLSARSQMCYVTDVNKTISRRPCLQILS